MSLDSRAAKAGLTLTPALKAAIYDGNYFALMAGAGEGYLSAFAIFLGGTPLQLAVLTSLPAILGAAGQLVGLWILRFVTSRRMLICRAVFVNGMVWIPVVALPWLCELGESTVWIFIALMVVYHGSAGIAGPAWNSLIGELVPEQIRGSYFGFRNRLIGLFTFLAMLSAGQMLQFAAVVGNLPLGYAAIFSAACFARLRSRYWLGKYDDPDHRVSGHHDFSFWQFVRRAPYSNFARFVVYVAIINGAVAFSAPFFTLYMFRDLRFSYLEFTLTAAASVLVQFLTMQYWGKLADTFGSKKLLNILGAGVVVAPLLWLVSGSIWYIIGVQFFSGAVWAGFNLAAATFLFDAVTPAKRARCTAYQAVMNSIFVTIGALAGGALAGSLPNSVAVLGWEWTPTSPLILLFVISAILRLMASVILLPRFREVTEVEPIRHTELLFRITGLRPISGVTFSIFTGGAKGRLKRNRRGFSGR
ncbi:MAG: MFS transporter [Proteobacteria bacterium]|nr:MFS transporter [Pseudomonadota bacterium]